MFSIDADGIRYTWTMNAFTSRVRTAAATTMVSSSRPKPFFFFFFLAAGALWPGSGALSSAADSEVGSDAGVPGSC